MYFEYGENEITYLRNKDKKLSEVMDQIGMIEREVDTDLFSSVVHHIIGQQISTKAQATIWQRMKENLGEVNAETILSADISKLQSLGMTFRKAEYITDFARKVHEGVFDLETSCSDVGRGGHQRTGLSERNWCMDGGDDLAFLPAAAGYIQL